MTGAAQHIAILLPDLHGGGAERVMLILAQEFAARGHKVDILLVRKEGALLGEAIQAGIAVTGFETTRLRQVVAPLRRWLLLHQPDVLIPAMWPLTSLAVLAARGTAAHVITTDHATLSAQYSDKGLHHRLALRASIRATYPQALANVSVSEGAARDLEALGRLSPDSVQVIHNPVARPRPTQRSAIWPAKARTRILAVGSLRWQKDFPTLIQALRMVRDKGCDAELVILGEGSERPALEALVQTLGLQSHVALPGFDPAPEAYFEAADIFALSSKSEGFANVVVEALSHGVPVVSCDCPHGPSEILAKGEFGRLVGVGDIDAFADALLATAAEPSDTKRLVCRAEDFLPEIAVEKYLSLFPSTFQRSERLRA